MSKPILISALIEDQLCDAGIDAKYWPEINQMAWDITNTCRLNRQDVIRICCDLKIQKEIEKRLQQLGVTL